MTVGAEPRFAGSFDDFAGASQKGGWTDDTSETRRLEVDHKLEPGRLNHGQVGEGFIEAVTGKLVTPPHSITSSARASSPGGMVRPSAFAALRLMINSKSVAC